MNLSGSHVDIFNKLFLQTPLQRCVTEAETTAHTIQTQLSMYTITSALTVITHSILTLITMTQSPSPRYMTRVAHSSLPLLSHCQIYPLNLLIISGAKKSLTQIPVSQILSLKSHSHNKSSHPYPTGQSLIRIPPSSYNQSQVKSLTQISRMYPTLTGSLALPPS